MSRHGTDQSSPLRLWRITLNVIDRLMALDARKPTSRQQFIHWLAAEAAHDAGIDPETLEPVPTEEPAAASR